MPGGHAHEGLPDLDLEIGAAQQKVQRAWPGGPGKDQVRRALALRIIAHELLPNLAPLLLVLFGLEMGRAIVVEAVLAFIGFSSSDISTWGAVIAGGRQYIYQAWWIMTLPIVVLVVTVLGLNAFGDGLRTAIDPVLQQ